MASRSFTPFQFPNLLYKSQKMSFSDKLCVILNIKTGALHLWKVKEGNEPESVGIPVYCMFVNVNLDAIYVGGSEYCRLELNVKKLDVVKSKAALGNKLKDKPMKEYSHVFTDFIHDNPNFKQFEHEAIKDALSNGIFDALGNNASKYIPHQILGLPQPPSDKGDVEKEAVDRQRKEKAVVPPDQKKKKDTDVAAEKLLSQSKLAAESQAAKDKALEDIPLPSPIGKRKRTNLKSGLNISLEDGSRNAESAEDQTVDAPASPLRKKPVKSECEATKISDIMAACFCQQVGVPNWEEAVNYFPEYATEQRMGQFQDMFKIVMKDRFKREILAKHTNVKVDDDEDALGKKKNGKKEKGPQKMLLEVFHEHFISYCLHAKKYKQ
ncbi:hypothetical protein R1flu_008858 [Riccia fluitans]|uniref:Uncharacterized protein n=1 Tax=Riccia fluitans TaxID=41844 RepID=A0ABD1Z0G2_9MARC